MHDAPAAPDRHRRALAATLLQLGLAGAPALTQACPALTLLAAEPLTGLPRPERLLAWQPGIYVAPTPETSLADWLDAPAPPPRVEATQVPSPRVTAYAVGPECTAQDLALLRLTTAYTADGARVLGVLTTALPPAATPSRRRILLRPVVQMRLQLHAATARLEVRWELRGPAGQLWLAETGTQSITQAARAR